VYLRSSLAAFLARELQATLKGGEVRVINFFGLSEESLALCQAAVDAAPPMTADQASRIGQLMGLVLVDLPPAQDKDSSAGSS
jgi:hypothetical protein